MERLFCSKPDELHDLYKLIDMILMTSPCFQKLMVCRYQWICFWILCYYLILGLLLFLLQVEMDTPQDMKHFIDEVLLRSTKEHLENQTKKFINYF
jgi:hypothetical protein